MASKRQPPKYIQQVLARASQEYGVPFDVLKRFAGIESSFNPRAKTGSYKGLFQLSSQEFKRGGGKGSIYDPEANTNAFVKTLKSNMAQFEKIMGRPPSGWEAYLVHQQGTAGGPAHLKNPDQPAWKSMYSTPEGRQKGARWAKKAIWGNVPASQKRQYKSVENITSGDFTNLWRTRYAREGGSLEDPTFQRPRYTRAWYEGGWKVH
jgi:hypothetical protein